MYTVFLHEICGCIILWVVFSCDIGIHLGNYFADHMHETRKQVAKVRRGRPAGSRGRSRRSRAAAACALGPAEMKTADAFERIGIADLEFHVRKNIEQCPRGLMLRELIRNAEEAAWLPEEESTGRRIEVRVYRVDEVNKLAVFNTGRGMDGDELVRATDLSCSIGDRKST